MAFDKEVMRVVCRAQGHSIVSLRVEEGEIVTLIGANGAGKTAAANGDPGRPSRTGKSNRRRRAKSQTPSDAVLTEALSSAPANAAGGNGDELAPGVGERLQRNVEEALDHAEE